VINKSYLTLKIDASIYNTACLFLSLLSRFSIEVRIK